MKKLIIIGGGVMGTVFAKALASSYRITVCDKGDDKNVCRGADVVLLAVKPQSFVEVADELRGKIFDRCLAVSIMAGVSIKRIQTGLKIKKVVRAMPNLGARVGKSMTVWTSAKEVNQKEKKFAQRLFSAIGAELYVKSEKMIDKATAVSGSGPGFLFYLVEEWLKAVEKLGFSTVESKKLLFSTLDATNTLLQKEKNPAELKKQVASKGGTTEAGLKVMKKVKLDLFWRNVLRVAVKRAEEMADIDI